MQDRNGVRLGLAVRDLDGRSLGRVTRLFDEAFQTRKGIPVLFRRDHVIRYDEVRGERDGELIVARSSSDVFDLSAGEMARSWRIPVPRDFPAAATPSEASFLREDIAGGAIPGEAPSPPPTTSGVPPAGVEPEREAYPHAGIAPRGRGAADTAAASGERPTPATVRER